MHQLLTAATLLLTLTAPQARDGSLSEREIDTLRDAAYTPTDRILAYEKILENREKRITDLLTAKHRHVTFGEDMHDAIDQFGQIADELNDNLETLDKQHRDLRKVLPRLILNIERWSTILRTPPDDEAYKIVRKVALDALKDTRELAESAQAGEEAYFKAHPEAAKAEKDRLENPHTPNSGESPH